MYIYKYNGEGMLAFKQDGVRHKVAVGHPTLKDIVELSKKLEESFIIGDSEKLKKLELVDKPKKRGE